MIQITPRYFALINLFTVAFFSLLQALHLIKAVSVLLDFTHDEQQLLKDTLEYKMSWFGGFKSPSSRGSGQMAKTIPPSY